MPAKIVNDTRVDTSLDPGFTLAEFTERLDAALTGLTTTLGTVGAEAPRAQANADGSHSFYWPATAQDDSTADAVLWLQGRKSGSAYTVRSLELATQDGLALNFDGNARYNPQTGALVTTSLKNLYLGSEAADGAAMYLEGSSIKVKPGDLGFSGAIKSVHFIQNTGADTADYLKVTGNITYKNGVATAGRITGYEYGTVSNLGSDDGEPVFEATGSVSGLKLNAKTLAALEENGFDALAAGIYAGNDNLAGTEDADYIDAAGGNDRVAGGAGDDTVAGGAGKDRLTGGDGNDIFSFANFGTANADVVTDFKTGEDTLQFDDTVFTSLVDGIGAENLVVGTRAAAIAKDADDFLIFNTATRKLYYDADGSGAGKAQLVATLVGVSTLTADDLDLLPPGA